MTSVPLHIYAAWRRWNLLIDAALALDMRPWPLAELAACSIEGEWVK